MSEAVDEAGERQLGLDERQVLFPHSVVREVHLQVRHLVIPPLPRRPRAVRSTAGSDHDYLGVPQYLVSEGTREGDPVDPRLQRGR